LKSIYLDALYEPDPSLAAHQHVCSGCFA